MAESIASEERSQVAFCLYGNRHLFSDKNEGNYSVGLRGTCPSEARALAALTVRKPGITSKNPIAKGDFKWIFARNCEGIKQLQAIYDCGRDGV